MSYKAYILTFMSMPRNHIALFIETDPGTRKGHILQVTGNIQEGMEYEHESTFDPASDPTFDTFKYVRIVAMADYPTVKVL